jgi:hypothetical protein
MALVFGCAEQAQEKDAGASYADLVVIHSAEQASLDRLERKRGELIAKYEARLRPSTDKALETLSGMLKTDALSNAPSDPNEALDPNAMLDRAVEDAERAQNVAGQLLDSLASDAVEDEEIAKKLQEEHEVQLAAIDKEIEEQRERVRRARQARDAAEAAQK